VSNEITAYCAYCTEPFTAKAIVDDSGPWRPYSERLRDPHYRPQRMTCSDACRKRNAVWNAWLGKVRLQENRGDVNKPIKLASLGASGLLKATERFAVVDDNQLILA